MRSTLFTFLVTALAWLGIVSGHNIQLKAHSRECFHEHLHRDDKMTVTFQVGDREFGGSGNLDIDFWVWQTLIFFLLHDHGNSTMGVEPQEETFVFTYLEDAQLLTGGCDYRIGPRSRGAIQKSPTGRFFRRLLFRC
jgi:hypothetical protein